MAVGTPLYPASLDTDATIGPTTSIVAGTTKLNAVGSGQGDQLGITRNLIAQIEAVEGRLGVAGATDPLSIEYRVRKRPFHVWIAGREGSPPISNFATPALRNSRPILVYNDSVTSGSLFFTTIPLGTAIPSGLLVRLKWMAATATAGSVMWGAAVERVTTDQDVDSFDVQISTLTPTASVAGVLVETRISLAMIDSLTAGSSFVLQIQRIGLNAGDNMIGAAQLQFVSIEAQDPMTVPTQQTVPLFNDQFGFSTHYDQAGDSSIQSQQTLPSLIKTGAGWIRDDINWPQIEATPGVYNWANLKPFWAIAQSAGLKVVVILGPNATAYPADRYNQTAMVNFAKLIPAHIPNCVIEVTNEPNNDYQSAYTSTTWQPNLVALTNAITTGVHSVFPSIVVIGLGAQGSQITNMISLGGNPDGIVYHPYDLNDSIAEHTFEPGTSGGNDYQGFVAALRAVTAKPFWETERNVGGPAGTVTEYIAAIWNARRVVLSLALSIEHSFLYDYFDTGSQTVVSNPQAVPLQPYFVLKRTFAVLAGLLPSASSVTVSSPSATFTNFKSFVFTAPNQRTVAVVWFGNVATVKIIIENNSLWASGVQNKTGFIAFPHGTMTEPIQVLDSVTGELIFRPTTDYGPNGLFMEVTDRPQFITIQ